MPLIKMSPEKFSEISNTVFGRFLIKNKLVSELVRYIYDEDFENEELEKEILGSIPYYDIDNPSYFSREQEYCVFRKMNLLKHKSFKLLNKDCLSKTDRRQIVDWLRESVGIKKNIAESNVRICHKFVGKICRKNNFEKNELIGYAFEICMLSISYFEFNKGFKFSTYLTTNVLRNLYKKINKVNKENRKRVVSLCSDLGEIADINNFDKMYLDEKDDKNFQRESMIRDFVNKIVSDLNKDKREEVIIKKMFLEDKKNSLCSIGKEFGLSKERIRQLKVSAIERLRILSLSYCEKDKIIKELIGEFI